MSLLPGASIIYVIEPFGGSIRRHNPALPLLFADDAGITRGEGVFEVMAVRHGQPRNVQAHLERFAAAAAAMALPQPVMDKWLEATHAAIQDAGEVEEAKCTWTYTRGRASTGIPSAWVTLQAIDEQTLAQRAHGVKAGIATRKAAAGGGTKTINYAATMAALREAAQQGWDEVIFVDEDGLLLEGSRSALVAIKGGKVRTPQAQGIVPSTTLRAFVDLAREAGFKCKEKPMTPDYLHEVDSVWLLSSSRGPVRVTHLDGTKLPEHPVDPALGELMERAAFG